MLSTGEDYKCCLEGKNTKCCLEGKIISVVCRKRLQVLSTRKDCDAFKFDTVHNLRTYYYLFFAVSDIFSVRDIYNRSGSLSLCLLFFTLVVASLIIVSTFL